MWRVKPTVRQPINYSGQTRPCVAAGCWTDGGEAQLAHMLQLKRISTASTDSWK